MKVSGLFPALLACLALSAVPATAATITLTGSGGSIPDNGSFSDTISNLDDGVIQDVTLTLFDFTHTWLGDLTATVEFAGTTGTLFERVGRVGSGTGSSSRLDGDFAFNDAFAGNLWSAAPFSTVPGGSFFATGQDNSVQIPFSSLWNGLTATGDWTLMISDSSGGDGGEFASWRLEIQTASAATPVPEPATLVLLGSSLAGLAAVRRRRRNRRT